MTIPQNLDATARPEVVKDKVMTANPTARVCAEEETLTARHIPPAEHRPYPPRFLRLKPDPPLEIPRIRK